MVGAVLRAGRHAELIGARAAVALVSLGLAAACTRGPRPGAPAGDPREGAASSPSAQSASGRSAQPLAGDAPEELAARDGAAGKDAPPGDRAPGPAAAPIAAAPVAEGFVDLAAHVPGLRLDIRYATTANFTGAPLPGYAPGCAWLRRDAADALARVQAELAGAGRGLLVYDAYRPVRATRAMVAWAETAGRTDLFDDGYVARRSNHNRGSTVDLTLVDATTGEPLPMGTDWDTFSTASHFASAKGAAMAHRRALRRVMVAHGFAPYAKEWWHFTFTTDPVPPAIDVPYPAPDR